KRALRVVQEDLKIDTFAEYLALLHVVDSSEKGILEKVKRRVNQKALHLSASELETIKAIILELPKNPLARAQAMNGTAALAEWLKHPAALEHLEWIETLIKRRQGLPVIIEALSRSTDPRVLPLVDLLITHAGEHHQRLHRVLLKTDFYVSRPDFIKWNRRLIVEFGSHESEKSLMDKLDPKNDVDLVEALLRGSLTDATRALQFLESEKWQGHQAWTKWIVSFLNVDANRASHLSLRLGRSTYSPRTKLLVAKGIESFLMSSRDFTSQLELFKSYGAFLRSQTGPTIDVPAFRTKFIGRLTAILRESAKPKEISAILQIFEKLEERPLEAISIAVKSLSSSERNAIDGILISSGWARERVIANGILDQFAAWKPEERISSISGYKDYGAVLLKAAELFGSRDPRAKEAIHFLRAVGPTLILPWTQKLSPHDLMDFQTRDRLDEARLRFASILRETDGSGRTLLIAWSNADTEVHDEFMDPKVALVLEKALDQRPRVTDNRYDYVGGMVVEALALSPLARSPEFRAKLLAAVDGNVSNWSSNASYIIGILDSKSPTVDEIVSGIHRTSHGLAFLKAVDRVGKLDVEALLGSKDSGATSMIMKHLLRAEKFDSRRHGFIAKRVVATSARELDMVRALLAYYARTDAFEHDAETLRFAVGTHSRTFIWYEFFDELRKRGAPVSKSNLRIIAENKNIVNDWVRYVLDEGSRKNPVLDMDGLRSLDFYLNEVASLADVRNALTVIRRHDTLPSTLPIFRRLAGDPLLEDKIAELAKSVSGQGTGTQALFKSNLQLLRGERLTSQPDEWVRPLVGLWSSAVESKPAKPKTPARARCETLFSPVARAR
ncbi:MAG: hypothetical protein V4760_08075, partial [Bdellovibrionota bacterium]